MRGHSPRTSTFGSAPFVHRSAGAVRGAKNFAMCWPRVYGGALCRSGRYLGFEPVGECALGHLQTKGCFSHTARFSEDLPQ